MNNYYAEIEWKGDVPHSKSFNDVYYSDESGIEESKYVFLQHNSLSARFSSLENGKFIIAETGFGAGINFLSTCELWHDVVKDSSTLHYISIEKYPLHPSDIYKILQNFPTLSELAKKLIAQYYVLLSGYHRIKISSNIYLTLIIGDVCEKLPELDLKVDAWFLDGFSPNKNHVMWNDLTIKEISRLSKKETTFATYTASSQVRNTLIKFGFQVNKDKGFGRKREMLYGKCTENNIEHLPNKFYKPYYHHGKSGLSTGKKIVIIGAGISGAATAYSLAKRGYNVTVLEKEKDIALGASGNYQGMLYGTWSIFGGEMMELSSSAYRYSNFLIKSLLDSDINYQECGIIQLSHNEKQYKRNQQLVKEILPNDFIKYVNQEEIAKISGYNIQKEVDGIFFYHGLWLNPPSLVNALLDHININVKLNSYVTDIIFENEHWNLNIDSKYEQFDAVVICNSFMVNQFDMTSFIPLRKIRGQISIANSSSHNLKCVICGDGYITPKMADKFTLGATFDFINHSTEINQLDNTKNTDNFKDILPEIINNLEINNLEGRASLRASPYDYMPVVGPVADQNSFINDFAKLSKDKNSKFNKVCSYLPNMYVNVGHGSKGMLTAPFCGEIIADYIDDTPIAASEKLRQSLHPNRFLVNNLIRNTNKKNQG